MPLLGIDEVGRGPWAGPLVMGAVILGDSKNPLWEELTDSKKLTKLRREKLAPKIHEQALATGLGWVYIDELNQIGLAAGLRTAARRAVEDCLKDTDFNDLEIIIDGTINFLKDTPYENKTSVMPKADLRIKEVSAASIIAKVARDNYMIDIAKKKYPEYGFENHVGYGTAKHQEALKNYGPCPEHRTFVRPVAKMFESQPSEQPAKNTTKVGQAAEKIVAEYLEEQGHKILARNFKTRFYEIDIISATAEHIYFTEVKYRKSKFNGTPFEIIDEKKRRRMTFAADSFMKYLAKCLDRGFMDLPSPVLAAASVCGPDFTFEDWFLVI